jgi:ABC-type taurine transport system substrate-binding protein
MTDPFNAWSRMFAAGVEMQSTWLRGLETMQASGAVIGARTDKMRDAARAPLEADLAEFSRMVPEKVDAFSRSAHSIARDTMAMHADWAIQMQRVGLMMLAGRVPTVIEGSRLFSQSADYALRAVTAGAKLGRGALAPVHRAATGNAQRLKRQKAR